MNEHCIVLSGRVLLPDGEELDCLIRFDSGTRMRVVPSLATEGARLLFHVDDLGAVEGIAGPSDASEQAVTMCGTPSHLAKLSSRIEWHRREGSTHADQRQHARVVPRIAQVAVRLACGTELTASLIDLSATGAALRVDACPMLGSRIVIGRRHGKVVRHLECGIAVAFNLPLRPQDVTPETIL